MRRYICLLAKTLGSLVHERYVILIVDTAKAHIHQSIYKLARQRGLRLVFVPARMTPWWLQPCDTHVFGPFKTALMENWKRSKSEALSEGVVDAQRWLQVIFKTIDQVLPGDWSKAFHRDGILNQQADLSDGRFGQVWVGSSCLWCLLRPQHWKKPRSFFQIGCV